MICFGPGSDSEPFSDLSRLGWRGGGGGGGRGGDKNDRGRGPKHLGPKNINYITIFITFEGIEIIRLKELTMKQYQ